MVSPIKEIGFSAHGVDLSLIAERDFAEDLTLPTDEGFLFIIICQGKEILT